jgi:predicted exporter
LWAWLAFHVGLAIALAASLAFAPRPALDTDLLSVIPRDKDAEAGYASADKALAERTARRVVALFGAASFAAARQSALDCAAAITATPNFKRDYESLAVRVDADAMETVPAFYRAHKFSLLDASTRQALSTTDGAAEVARTALATAFSAFSLNSMSDIMDDPFGLADSETRSFLKAASRNAPAWTAREGVLAAQHEGRWYVLLRATLSQAGASLEGAAVSGLCERFAAVEKTTPEVVVVYSGVPFHSYESATQARREVSVISVVSLALIALLFIATFRTMRPLAWAAVAVAASVGSALAAAFLAFRSVHVITLVFGTTLLGCCVDYAIHYFAHEGKEGSKELRRALTAGFASTEVCFALLLFTPFAILRQFAVFSLAGMESSDLSAMCLFPALSPRLRPRDASASTLRLQGLFVRLPRAPAWARWLVLGVLTAAAVAFLATKNGALSAHNDIRALYTPSTRLMQNERVVASVSGVSEAPWYYLVKGATKEAMLKAEEQLCKRLDGEVASGRLDSYLATTMIVPSRATQQANYAAAGALLPYVAAQFAALGAGQEAANAYRKEYAQAADDVVTVDDALPGPLATLAGGLYLGAIDGAHYGCVLLRGATSAAAAAALAQEMPDVMFMNRVERVNADLDALTRSLLRLYLVAYALVLVAAMWRRSPADVARIAVCPLAAGLAALVACRAAGIGLGFFPATALSLVFGLGLDYAFYAQVRGTGQTATLAAMALSFATTALSFGALAFCSFAPVRSVGVVVAAGLAGAAATALLTRQ